MFSKSRINESASRNEPQRPVDAPMAPPSRPSMDLGASASAAGGSMGLKAKPPASTLSADLQVTGNLRTSGDIVIEGVVDGDIRAHLLTVGESATIRGEIVADDIVINGRVIGRVRGLKVRLTSTARVEGDIIHKTIAIESGAHFEGSVQRQDDPLAAAQQPAARSPAPQQTVQAASPAPQPRPAAPDAQRPAAPKPPVDTKPGS